MAIIGALTTPGTAKPLAIIDMGAGSTDASIMTTDGAISSCHLAGAGNMVTLLIDKELGINNIELSEDIKKYPLAKVADYLKHATVKELDVKDFTIPEVVASIKEDMELMLADARKIREVANEEDDFLVANMMEDHIAYFVKQLWFIQAMSK
mgnify:CR=1 FL=1